LQNPSWKRDKEAENKMVKANFMKKNVNPTYENFIVTPLKEFDERNTVLNRAKWDEKIKKLITESCEPGWFLNPVDNPLYIFPTSGLQIVRNIGSEINDWCAASLCDASKKIYEDLADKWNGPINPEKLVKNPADMSDIIKKVAKLLGADLVGICELDKRWIYKNNQISHRYAISIAVEMESTLLSKGPSYAESVATGMAYSKARCISTALAQFIRGIGYSAFANVNERVLEIPIAIDAGLGELGRNGLLITPEFGPRVRLCSVTTELPLKKDSPIDFSIQLHCEKCEKCAKSCPAQAIKSGSRTTQINNISNREGLLRWPVDFEKCLVFWGGNKSERQSCAKCISVCPFNIKNGKTEKPMLQEINFSGKKALTDNTLNSIINTRKQITELFQEETINIMRSKIIVKFYSDIRGIIGLKEITFEIDEGETIFNIVIRLCEKFPQFSKIIYEPNSTEYNSSILILLNKINISFLDAVNTKLKDGDEITFFAGVSGGECCNA
jgi:MoaD family protein